MKTTVAILNVCAFLMLSLSLHAQSEFTAPPSVSNRVVKLDFFSPLTGNLTLSYEQVLTNKVTLQGSLGIIGVSFVEVDHAKGIFLKVGPRLYFNPDYMLEGMKRYNDFQGTYFNPQIIYSGFGFDYDSYNSLTGVYSDQRATNNSIALMLNFGRQWVLAKTISLDLHAGIGYGTSFFNYVNLQPPTTGSQDQYLTYKFSHAESPEIPLVFSAGFDIGLLLK